MITILTYHAIGDGPRPLWNPVDEFEAQLDTLVRLGFSTVSLPGVSEAPKERETADRRIAITFDDGYASFFEIAWPRLVDRGFGATVFVIAGRCGSDNQWPGQPGSIPPAALLDWDELGALADQGCSLGSHTVTHSPLFDTADPDVLHEEIVGSKQLIESRTGSGVASFAYPYGHVSPRAAELVRNHYAAAVTTGLRGVGPGQDPHRLPRIDACYVSPATLRGLESGWFETYIAIRRGVRSIRRIASSDWDDSSLRNDSP